MAKKTKTTKPRVRRARVPRAPTDLRMKPYRFKFTVPAQILIPDGATGMSFSTATGSGPLPLKDSEIINYPSNNGLVGFKDIGLATTFKLTDLANYAEFTHMFDAYRVNKVTCEIQYLNNVSAVNTTGLMPSIYLYWDQDDAVIPSIGGLNIQGKQGVKRIQFGNKARTSIRTSGRPKLQALVGSDSTVGADAAVVMKSTWLDCLSPEVNHYALKMYITDLYLPNTLAVQQAFRFNWTYDVSFRAPLLTT